MLPTYSTKVPPPCVPGRAPWPSYLQGTRDIDGLIFPSRLIGQPMSTRSSIEASTGCMRRRRACCPSIRAGRPIGDIPDKAISSPDAKFGCLSRTPPQKSRWGAGRIIFPAFFSSITADYRRWRFHHRREARCPSEGASKARKRAGPCDHRRPCVRGASWGARLPIASNSSRARGQAGEAQRGRVDEARGEGDHP